MKPWRHYTVVGFFVFGCAGLVARLVYLSITDREFLQSQGDARSIRYETLRAYRGVVYDRQGQPLAVSTPVVAVWTNPSSSEFDEVTLTKLAKLLELDMAVLERRLEVYAKRKFMYLKRRLPWEKAEQLRALKLAGVFFQPEYRRYYPASEMAAHVVGVTDVDDAGLEGIELSFDELLKGRHGRKMVLKDQRGNTVKDLEYLSTPQFGTDLSLSLDLRLQYFAHRELKAAVAGHRAVSASLVMLDVRTGEVLALVNQPSYNPNELSGSRFDRMRNRAVTDTYEPGSTVKPFTVLAALESGRYRQTSLIDTSPGYFKVGNKLIEDPINRGVISLSEVLQKSSQVGIARVALRLEARAVYEVLVRAGVGAYVGTGLPGESMGKLSDLGLDNPVMRATLAYGYGLAVSPLQLAQAYLSLATLGIRMPVSILKQSVAPEGRRVFDAKQVRQVLDMMVGVTEDGGTAPKARVTGYRVAGKTGTSRKVGALGYDDKRHVALFAGIIPASDPRIVIVVVVNEPRGEIAGGGTVAAPIFARVAARTMRLLGIKPDSVVSLPESV
ncbi:MAG: penicillin-binding transpeptidase domain-containing protein [Gammaproteobacteria bacterium]|nr:penicillin-binding transpeptidase domain-containing protein [Gammaproteobacteria bacterium]